MGFFDTKGEKLYKEMDRAMSDLMSVNKDLKSEIIANIQAFIPELLEQSLRWSIEGKFAVAKKLQDEGKSKRSFDIAGYVSTFMVGAYLESLLLPNDPHAKHVMTTIDRLLAPIAKKTEPSLGAMDRLYNFIELGLVLPLAIHYRREFDTLSEFDVLIRNDGERNHWMICSFAFGLIDAIAQSEELTQTEHLAFATMFFIKKMHLTPEQAGKLVGRLIKVNPSSPEFELIYKGGIAMNNYLKEQNVENFCVLSELLG